MGNVILLIKKIKFTFFFKLVDWVKSVYKCLVELLYSHTDKPSRCEKGHDNVIKFYIFV